MDEILTHPNAALKQRAAEVDVASDSDLRALCKQMATVLYEAPGIGLAATQVGVMKRVIIYDLDDERGIVALCNPRIVSVSDETTTDEEGCLSLPGITVNVERAVRLTCQAETLKGSTVTFEAEELHARLLQHEIDHLDGILIIDRAAPEERKAALRRYLDLSAAAS